MTLALDEVDPTKSKQSGPTFSWIVVPLRGPNGSVEANPRGARVPGVQGALPLAFRLQPLAFSIDGCA
jgi:hypothetical protein